MISNDLQNRGQYRIVNEIHVVCVIQDLGFFCLILILWQFFFILWQIILVVILGRGMRNQVHRESMIQADKRFSLQEDFPFGSS